ncbi:choice-of-anchor A family protein, partial [Kitasatospora sp. MBT63]
MRPRTRTPAAPPAAPPTARPRRTALRRAAVVTGLTAPLFGVAALISAAPLPPPLGACTGAQCPNPFPRPAHNGNFAGRDASISVFAGGTFTATGRAAEAEGQVVVLGDITIDKTGGGVYNMGVAGVGSRVPPPDGSDHVTTGGNLTVAATSSLLIGGSDLSPATAWGNVRHRGTTSGSVVLTPPGQQIQDAAAGDKYASLRTTIADLSKCAGAATATGTVATAGPTVTFTGDGTSARQVFTVTDSIGTTAQAADLVFKGIPAGATVIVNLLADDALVSTNTGSGNPGDPVTDLGPKLLWNFPNATTARIAGGAQFQGSVLGGNPAGTTTVSTPGLDGRVYLAGSLVHTSASTGVEIHNYPFNGDLPDCATTPPTTSASASDSGSPTPTPTPTPSPTPSPTASGSD